MSAPATRAEADAKMVDLAVWALRHGSAVSVVVDAIAQYAEIAVATDERRAP